MTSYTGYQSTWGGDEQYEPQQHQQYAEQQYTDQQYTDQHYDQYHAAAGQYTEGAAYAANTTVYGNGGGYYVDTHPYDYRGTVHYGGQDQQYEAAAVDPSASYYAASSNAHGSMVMLPVPQAVPSGYHVSRQQHQQHQQQQYAPPTSSHQPLIDASHPPSSAPSAPRYLASTGLSGNPTAVARVNRSSGIHGAPGAATSASGGGTGGTFHGYHMGAAARKEARVVNRASIAQLARCAATWRVVQAYRAPVDSTAISGADAPQQTVTAEGLAELQARGCLHGTTLIAGCAADVPNGPVPAAMLRPLQFLLSLVAANRGYSPVSKEDVRRGVPRAGWCLPTCLFDMAPAPGVAAIHTLEDLLLSSPFWCLVTLYDQKGAWKAANSIRAADAVRRLQAGTVSAYTMALAVAEPYRNWVPTALTFPLGALLDAVSRRPAANGGGSSSVKVQAAVRLRPLRDRDMGKHNDDGDLAVAEMMPTEPVSAGGAKAATTATAAAAAAAAAGPVAVVALTAATVKPALGRALQPNAVTWQPPVNRAAQRAAAAAAGAGAPASSSTTTTSTAAPRTAATAAAGGNAGAKGAAVGPSGTASAAKSATAAPAAAAPNAGAATPSGHSAAASAKGAAAAPSSQKAPVQTGGSVPPAGAAAASTRPAATAAPAAAAPAAASSHGGARPAAGTATAQAATTAAGAAPSRGGTPAAAVGSSAGAPAGQPTKDGPSVAQSQPACSSQATAAPSAGVVGPDLDIPPGDFGSAGGAAAAATTAARTAGAGGSGGAAAGAAPAPAADVAAPSADARAGSGSGGSAEQQQPVAADQGYILLPVPIAAGAGFSPPPQHWENSVVMYRGLSNGAVAGDQPQQVGQAASTTTEQQPAAAAATLPAAAAASAAAAAAAAAAVGHGAGVASSSNAQLVPQALPAVAAFESAAFRVFQGPSGDLTFRCLWWCMDHQQTIFGPFSAEQMILAHIALLVSMDALLAWTPAPAAPSQAGGTRWRPTPPPAAAFRTLWQLFAADAPELAARMSAPPPASAPHSGLSISDHLTPQAGPASHFETAVFQLFEGVRAQYALSSQWWVVDQGKAGGQAGGTAAAPPRGPHSAEQMIKAYISQVLDDDMLTCGVGLPASGAAVQPPPLNAFRRVQDLIASEAKDYKLQQLQ